MLIYVLLLYLYFIKIYLHCVISYLLHLQPIHEVKSVYYNDYVAMLIVSHLTFAELLLAAGSCEEVAKPS